MGLWNWENMSLPPTSCTAMGILKLLSPSLLVCKYHALIKAHNSKSCCEMLSTKAWHLRHAKQCWLVPFLGKHHCYFCCLNNPPRSEVPWGPGGGRISPGGVCSSEGRSSREGQECEAYVFWFARHPPLSIPPEHPSLSPFWNLSCLVLSQHMAPGPELSLGENELKSLTCLPIPIRNPIHFPWLGSNMISSMKPSWAALRCHSSFLLCFPTAHYTLSNQ